MNDIADARSIAVVRTRLPYIDRRALSQAWFSALHIGEAVPSGGARRAPNAPTMVSRTTHATSIANRRSAVSGTPKGGPVARLASARRSDATPEPPAARLQRVRAQRTLAATTPASAVDPRSYPPFQTSLTVGVEGARVALLLRREGATLHVVALCAPANVELVRRTLACADAHLRLHGDRVRASVRSADEVRA